MNSCLAPDLAPAASWRASWARQRSPRLLLRCSEVELKSAWSLEIVCLNFWIY